MLPMVGSMKTRMGRQCTMDTIERYHKTPRSKPSDAKHQHKREMKDGYGNSRWSSSGKGRRTNRGGRQRGACGAHESVSGTRLKEKRTTQSQ
eukprot:2812733-Pleurochrysis_carterae.AAC.3